MSSIDRKNELAKELCQLLVEELGLTSPVMTEMEDGQLEFRFSFPDNHKLIEGVHEVRTESRLYNGYIHLLSKLCREYDSRVQAFSLNGTVSFKDYQEAVIESTKAEAQKYLNQAIEKDRGNV